MKQADDLLLVQSLAHEIWREYYPRILSSEQIEYMLASGYSVESLEAQRHEGVRFEIIGENDGFVGYGPVGPGEWKLHKLYLKASARGSGLGRRALVHVETECKKAGAHKLVLNVNKHNTLAMRAYERAGFVRESEVVIDIGSGFVMDDYVYGKAL